MKTRIIAAAVLVPVLFLIVLVAPESAAAAILGILLAIASYELLYRTGLVKHPRLVVYSSVMAFALSMWSYFGAVRAYFVLMLMVYTMLLFAEMMLDHIKIRFEIIGMCFVSGVIIPYLLTALIRILTMDIGRYVILIPFIVAFMNDAGAYFVLMLMVYAMVLFAEMMLDHIKVHFETICMCFVSGVIIPYLLTSLIRILTMDIGRYVILIPFIVAFMSDAGAYFVGLKFGRHKLAPVVSPNKTIEGVFGGLAGATIGMLIYTIILDWPLKLDVSYVVALLYGVAGSAVGTFGDLCFSVIKRQTGIKDYGNLIPGHGGVLDRFDSLTMVAPLMEALLLILPLIRL